MPPWAQWIVGTIISLSALVIALGDRIGRWGGRAQRQDSDGRVLERTADATQRHEVTDATLANSLSTLTDAVKTFDKKLDKLTEDHRETRETSVRHEAERTADRDRLARLEADNASLRAEMRDLDQRHINARHDLRDSLHGPNAVTEVVAAIKAQGEATTRAAAAMEAVARSLTEAPRAARPARRG